MDDQNKTTDDQRVTTDSNQPQNQAENKQEPQQDQAQATQMPAPEENKPEEPKEPDQAEETKSTVEEKTGTADVKPNEPDQKASEAPEQKIEEATAPKPEDAAKAEPAGQKEEASGTTSESDQTAPTPAVPTQTDVPGAHWYVVHTYSGHEAKVAATLKQRVESQKLADKILDILVPTQEKIEIKEGKKTNVKEKIFPGYLLIRMVLDDSTWLAVRTTPGITSFVGNANKPTPLPEEEVAGIRKFMEMEAPTFKSTFSVGEAVRITDGPFSEFLGSINEIDQEKGKLKVMVSIFGRETPVELDFLQVAKL